MQSIKFLPLVLVPFLAFAACSGDDKGGDAGGDAGGDVANSDAPVDGFHQTGQIVDYSSGAGLGGATITGGGSTTQGDSKGNYDLVVPKNTPYSMTTSLDGYLTLHEQEWQLSADSVRGKTSAVANGTEQLLKSILQPQPDPTLGVLTIQVIATGGDAGGCASATGATISVPGLAVDGGTGAHLVYFDGGSPNLPSASATSVTDGALPSAIIYDLPIGMFSSVTVTHPTCSTVPFPVADPNIPTLTYTGKVDVEASSVAVDDAGTMGNVASFMRVFLK
ncbi:MAG TPA: hypothetical protein VGH28_08725 [Polyangiaceae bacterium]|jgi:hypothetical protein